MGAYTATYTAPFFIGDFATNGAGQVTSAYFPDCCLPDFTNSGNNAATDTFETSLLGQFFTNSVNDTQGRRAFISSGSTSGTYWPTNPSLWTASLVVPIPAALWLFGSALIGLIGVARREARA